MDYPDYIPRLEAVALIAKRTQPKYEKKREWKNKINERIKYQIKTGKLTVNAGKRICFAELSDYVKQVFPGVFDDLPTTPAVMRIELQGFDSNLYSYGCGLPSDITECHQQILRLNEEAEKQKRINRELQTEIERLKPAAERYWENCKKNRENAKKCQ